MQSDCRSMWPLKLPAKTDVTVFVMTAAMPRQVLDFIENKIS